jgi:NAD dependent epimerase/dehydratase
MSESLEGKSVFVTGADGFIGSHLVEALVTRGAKVRALVFYNSWNQRGWLSDVPAKVLDKVELFQGDVRDAARMHEGARGCEYIMHLASLIAIPYSYSATQSFIDTNVSGTFNVLQAARASSALVRMLHVSTSEVYGSAQTVPIAESHPLVGQSPYAASKIGADKIAESFHRSFDLPVVTARPFNTFGPRQTARAVIPTICSQLLAGCEQLRLGALTPTRDFNYAVDTAQGMIELLICKAAEGRTVNIGTGEEWSIGQTAEMLMEITGRKVPVITEDERTRPAKSEVNRLLADNRLIRELTPWQPKFDFPRALSATATWIGANLQHFDVKRFNI